MIPLPKGTGVSYFFEFMVTNKGNGPFGYETDAEGLEIGDVVQLSMYNPLRFLQNYKIMDFCQMPNALHRHRQKGSGGASGQDGLSVTGKKGQVR